LYFYTFGKLEDTYKIDIINNKLLNNIHIVSECSEVYIEGKFSKGEYEISLNKDGMTKDDDDLLYVATNYNNMKIIK
jgi:hypothetical protein